MRTLKISLLVLILTITLFAQAPDTLWTKTFGGIDGDFGYSVQQTLDGGYIISGSTESFGVGYNDVWLIKTNAVGDTIWTKTFGGVYDDRGFSVQQTTDNGYIICGHKDSAPYGIGDIWLIKSDAYGNILWDKTFGGPNQERGNDVKQTTDGGLTWASSTTTFQNNNGVAFTDVSTGVSAGEDINWTTDGGATWFIKQAQIPGEIVSAASARQIEGKFFFVTGTDVFKTNNLGDSYDLDFSQTDTLNFINIDVIKVGENYWITGYAAGNNGSIAKYKELYLVTETEPIQNIIPEFYSLKQNYPNPFNPTTSIEFSLPVAADVELNIFNILGQKVATLINEQRSAGYYSVQWNANDSNGMKLSSGIYFYMLKASGIDGNEFQEIKKMILLK